MGKEPKVKNHYRKRRSIRGKDSKAREINGVHKRRLKKITW